nr:trpA [Pseudoerythrocladia kornmannii]
MSNTISDTFKDLGFKKECALVPFITAGDPNLNVTEEALKILDAEGANLIELGLPYSDSLADGPVIQAAAARALHNQLSLEDIFNRIAQLAPNISTPIVIFTYFNLILSQGVDQFVTRVRLVGAKGLIVPDLPVEESEYLLKLCEENSLELILLISPTSSIERIKLIAEKSQGCLYIVAGTGVTGFRANVDIEVKNLISRVKSVTKKPVIIGFGISTSAQASLVKSWGADGVVLGSAFVNKMSNFNSDSTLLNLRSFCREIKQALLMK